MAYQSYTLATLKTRLADKWEATPFWSDAEATLVLNEALRIWNLLTGYWKRREQILITANEHNFALSGSMVYSMRVEWESRPLAGTSLHNLDNGQPSWMSETTTSGGIVPTRPALWAPVSLMQIAIWPADAVGNSSIMVDGVAATPVLANDGDFIDLNDALLSQLLGYALHAASFKEGGQRWAGTLPLYQSFLAAAAEQNSQLKSSQFFRRALGLDTMRQFRPMHDNQPKVVASAAS